MSDLPKESTDFLQDPDVQDMLAVQSGDSPAFNHIMTRNYKRLHHFAYRFLGSRQHMAEDIVQGVFLKLYEMAPRYVPKARLSTLLFGMTRNACLNVLRQKETVSLDQANEDGQEWMHETIESSYLSSSGHMIVEEKEKAVRDAIESLPENQKSALILKVYHDLSYEEIAQTIGVSVSAVKSLLVRAKEGLAIALRGYLQDEK